MQKIKIQALGKFGVLKENEKLATEVLATQKQLFQKINELNRIKYELKIVMTVSYSFVSLIKLPLGLFQLVFNTIKLIDFLK